MQRDLDWEFLKHVSLDIGFLIPLGFANQLDSGSTRTVIGLASWDLDHDGVYISSGFMS